MRAQPAQPFKVPREVRTDLQIEVRDITTNFMHGPELEEREYGQLSELVAIAYLLNSTLFPYITTWREEMSDDWRKNHDVYSLHQCEKNQIKKAPASVKYFKKPLSNDAVVLLRIGRLSRHTASSVGLQLWAASSEKEQAAKAMHFAAEVMIDKLQGRTLNRQVEGFITGLTKNLSKPLRKFASQATALDYASNAKLLRQRAVRRKKPIQRGRS